jgi:ABC-type branched-subunit amino acid transport system permease subunit
VVIGGIGTIEGPIIGASSIFCCAKPWPTTDLVPDCARRGGDRHDGQVSQGVWGTLAERFNL